MPFGAKTPQKAPRFINNDNGMRIMRMPCLYFGVIIKPFILYIQIYR